MKVRLVNKKAAWDGPFEVLSLFDGKVHLRGKGHFHIESLDALDISPEQKKKALETDPTIEHRKTWVD